ncbi:MAG TPA: carboxypeptidase regulatory-like domain-containing protein [Candidatus Solibacter sp.]|nr:carboxypeptidase regulatory-like domain-containing protein [Candidatus Solibacter sp.]
MKKLMMLGVGVTCLVLALSLVPAVFAQTGTGAVRGTVTDDQGKAVAQAQVTMTNAETAYSRTVNTDANGNYGFQSLPVGRYTLKVASGQGFKTFEEKDIILHVNDNLTFDAKLTVGATSQTVEVEASPNQVELTSAELSGTIEGYQITELPLNGRSFAQLLTLVPGVEVDAGFSYDKKGLNGGADISISGGASNSNLFLVDGANNVDVGSNRTILIYPSLDSIQEFKVERNSYNAQFGGAGGGIVTLVTKSGTNSLHGSAYYFGRNDLLDAKDPVLNAIDPKSKKNSIRRNDFGFSIGGPIKKDKIFFFVSEEWNRLIQGVVRTAHVPTPLQRTGDFSDSALDTTFSSANTIGCLPLGGLHDPDPTNPGGAFTASGATPGVIDIIPAGRQSTAGNTILNTYFLPTLPKGAVGYGCGTNWAKSISQPTFFREDSVRGDINITKTTTLMMKYTGDYWDFGPSAVGNSGWGADSGASNIQEQWSQPGRIAVAKLSKVFGATAVNDFQFSYSANRINISQADPAAAQALNKAIPTFFPSSGNAANNPPVWINGGGLPTIWSFAPWTNREDLFAWQDDYSKVIKRHTLKMGVSYSRNAKDQDNFSQKQGVTFGPGGYNGCKNVGDPGCTGIAFTNTGYGPSDFLLKNQAVNWGEQNTIFKKQGRWQNLEAYVNDDWKLTPRLTLNLGLRYSFLPNPYQANDQLTVFNPTAFNPALGNAPCNGLIYSPGLGSNPCPAGTGGIAGPNRALQNNFGLGFAPRLGVAWDPTGSGKWSIRAGFGQFYNRDDIYITDGTAGVNPPFVGSFTSVNGNGRFLDNTNQLPACTPNCFGSASLGVAGIGQDLSSRAPYTLQYNLSIQHELWKDAKFEVGYVGSQTKNWTRKVDINAIAPADRLAFAQSNGNAAGNALKPFHVLTNGGLPFFAHKGSSEYDSLQTAFSTRFQRGSIFQLTYTYSKTYTDTFLHISNGGGNLIIDPFNPRNGYGLATINRPHILSANLIYNLPTLQNMQPIVRGALGSWEVGSIVNVSSGSSLTPVIGGISNVNDPSGIGIGTGVERPNIVPGQPCRNPSFANFQFLNPNRYTLNGLKLGTVGNAPVGDCLGPATRTVDSSVSKNFRVSERLKVQFRIDAFNLFNHPQYGNPGGGANTGAVSIGFGAAKFLDANGNPTPTLANAASLTGTSPNAKAGTVTTLSDRSREFQYSVRFTF